MTIQPLALEHYQSLAQQILGWVNVSRGAPAMRDVAAEQIGRLGWRWSADALRGPLVKVDLVKHDPSRLRHTQAARDGGANLRHEHAVPRSLLVQRTMALETPEQVLGLWGRYCIGIVVTKVEDEGLNAVGLRKAMPRGWQWGDDFLARYDAAGIQVLVPAPSFDSLRLVERLPPCPT